MAIPQTKYVNIISAVGGTSRVSQRDLIGRIFTQNILVPTGSVVEFSGGSDAALNAVGKYFGVLSDEYKIASKYFGYKSKKTTKPQKISFAHWANANTPAYLFGAPKSAKMAQFTTIANGEITFTIDGVAYELTGINLTQKTSLAEVADAISEALDEKESGIATFSYEQDTARFVLQTIATGAGHSITFATGNLAALVGMNQGNVAMVISDSADAETPVDALSASAELNNNFFAFDFIQSIAGNEEAIASWVNAQNIRYMWSKSVSVAEATELAGSLAEFDGVGLTLDKYNEMAGFLPMAIAAAINFDNANAAVNFMYQQSADITPSVNDATEQDAYDVMRVNYYGTTQQAGAPVSFYQNGVLLGSVSDMGVFVNEAWLKDAIFTSILNMRLGLDSLPANSTGLGLVKLAITSVIEKALNNGVISVGKTLDAAQKAYIAQLTGDADAWQQIQSNGYYLYATVEKYTESGIEKFKVSYLLVYAKGDSINFVDGRDILI